MNTEHHQAIPVVLVVDDEEDIRGMLQTFLEDEGYRVLQAGDGVEGLAIALAQHVDAILLDLAMPRLTGEAFCRAYRERDGTAGVILMTAATPERVTVARKACSGSSYLAKPFAVVDVLAALSEQLGPSPVSA
jgi:two-component system response regulator VanR